MVEYELLSLLNILTEIFKSQQFNPKFLNSSSSYIEILSLLRSVWTYCLVLGLERCRHWKEHWKSGILAFATVSPFLFVDCGSIESDFNLNFCVLASPFVDNVIFFSILNYVLDYIKIKK